MKCPVCDGKVWGTDFGEGTFVPDPCPYCEEKLSVSLYKWLSYHIWERMPVWMFDLYAWIAERKERRIEFKHIGKFRNWLGNILFSIFLLVVRQTKEEFELDLVNYYHEDRTAW